MWPSPSLLDPGGDSSLLSLIAATPSPSLFQSYSFSKTHTVTLSLPWMGPSTQNDPRLSYQSTFLTLFPCPLSMCTFPTLGGQRGQFAMWGIRDIDARECQRTVWGWFIFKYSGLSLDRSLRQERNQEVWYFHSAVASLPLREHGWNQGCWCGVFPTSRQPSQAVEGWSQHTQ